MTHCLFEGSIFYGSQQSHMNQWINEFSFAFNALFGSLPDSYDKKVNQNMTDKAFSTDL